MASQSQLVFDKYEIIKRLSVNNVGLRKDVPCVDLNLDEVRAHGWQQADIVPDLLKLTISGQKYRLRLGVLRRAICLVRNDYGTILHLQSAAGRS